jgi:TonB family protein
MTKKLFLLLMALLPMTMYSQSDKIYDMADPMPSFPGGLVELFNYLSKNTKYPAKEKAQLKGKVFVTFVVEKDGKISNPQIRKGMSSLIDAEAKRLVLAMPKWSAGKKDGQFVRTYYTVPVSFDYTKRGTGTAEKQATSKTQPSEQAKKASVKSDNNNAKKNSTSAQIDMSGKDIKRYPFILHNEADVKNNNNNLTTITINDNKETQPSITFTRYDATGKKELSKSTKYLKSNVDYDFTQESADDPMTIVFHDKNRPCNYVIALTGDGDKMTTLFQVYDNTKGKAIETYLSVDEEEDFNAQVIPQLIKALAGNSLNLYQAKGNLPNMDDSEEQLDYGFAFVNMSNPETWLIVELGDCSESGTTISVTEKIADGDVIKEMEIELKPIYYIENDIVNFFSKDEKYAIAFGMDGNEFHFMLINASTKKELYHGFVRELDDYEITQISMREAKRLITTAKKNELNLYDKVVSE